MDPLTLLTVASTAVSAVGSYRQGQAAKASAEYEAKQFDKQSKAATAEGTRAAEEIRRQGAIMQSNARAAMAGSGGTASDAGAISTLGKIGAETDYNSLAAMFEAKSEAQGLQTAASTRRYEGDLAQRAAKQKTLSTVLSGASRTYGSFKPRAPISAYRNTEIDMLRRAGKI
jgi:hypothetical protein